MNNEQNNMNGLLNINPIPSSNPEPAPPMTPGQNLSPITGNNQSPVTNIPEQNATIIPVGPVVPGIVTADNSNNNNLPPVNNNDNIIPINNTPVEPETVTNGTNELNSNLNIENSTPFDIGLNPQTLPSSQPLNQTIPIDNNTLSPLNNAQPLNNNMGDSTPLTNANVNNSNSNEEVVTVKQFLIYNILCYIPIVGLIVILVKAFGSKANKNISNLAKAQLLLFAIATVLSVVISIAFGTLLV